MSEVMYLSYDWIIGVTILAATLLIYGVGTIFDDVVEDGCKNPICTFLLGLVLTSVAVSIIAIIPIMLGRLVIYALHFIR